MKQFSLIVNDEHELYKLAQKLSYLLKNQSVVIFLEGDLGAGKTTFMRHYLAAMGYHDIVVSPTYTLVEVYELDSSVIVHSDCYRISEDDIYFLDFPGYLADTKPHQVWIEWAEQFGSVLPAYDLKINLIHLGEKKRELVFQVPVDSGLILDGLKN
jgi:tRNA threonylcarbamoyladenosine biosynthesis protein TsaE